MSNIGSVGVHIMKMVVKNQPLNLKERDRQLLEIEYNTKIMVIIILNVICDFMYGNISRIKNEFTHKIFNSKIFLNIYNESIHVLRKNNINDNNRIHKCYSDILITLIYHKEFEIAFKISSVSYLFYNYDTYLINVLYCIIQNYLPDEFIKIIEYIQYCQNKSKLYCNCLRLSHIAKELLLYNKTDYIEIITKYYPLFNDICDSIEKIFKKKVCVKCFIETEDMLICSICKITTYCSAECQRKDWKNHKTFCSAPKKINPKDGLKECLYYNHDGSLYCMNIWPSVGNIIEQILNDC